MKIIHLVVSITLYGFCCLSGFAQSEEAVGIEFSKDGKLVSQFPSNLNLTTKLFVSIAVPDSLVIQVFDNYEKAYSYFNKVKASTDSSFLDAFEVQNIKITIAHQLCQIQSSYPDIFTLSRIRQYEQESQSYSSTNTIIPGIDTFTYPTFQFKYSEISCETWTSVKFSLQNGCHQYKSEILDLKDSSRLYFKLSFSTYEQVILNELNKIEKIMYGDSTGLAKAIALGNNDEITKCTEAYIKSLQSWFYTFVLLTKGNPDTFILQSEALKEVKTQKKNLTKLNDLLAIQDKKIELFKVISSSEKISDCKTCATNTLLNYDILLKDRNSISFSIDSLKKIIAKEESSSQDGSLILFQDYLVYSGFIYRSNVDFSRYHDASNDFVLMRPAPAEITERQRMHIMVYNKLSSAPLKLKYSVVSIDQTNDSPPSVTNDFVRINVGTSLVEPIVRPSDQNELIIELRKRNNRYSKSLPNLAQDKSAKYIMSELDHELPVTGTPFKVPYSILAKGKDGKDSTVSNPNISYEYRVNKLYHYRFKPGIAFSWQKQSTYSIDANVPTRTTSRHGFDAILGMQYFIKKGGIDIRSTQLQWFDRSFFYLGFSFVSKPLQNIYCGLGIEPINGVAFMVGPHIGQTSTIVNNFGTLTVMQNKLNVGLFISLSVDFGIFNRFFDYGLIKYPLK